MVKGAPSSPKTPVQFAITNRRRHSLQPLQPSQSQNPERLSSRFEHERRRRWSATASTGADSSKTVSALRAAFISEPPQAKHSSGDDEERESNPAVQRSTSSHGSQGVQGEPDESGTVDFDTLRINVTTKGRGCLDISGAVEGSADQPESADKVLERMSKWNWSPTRELDEHSSPVACLEAQKKDLEQKLDHVRNLSKTLGTNGSLDMSASTICELVKEQDGPATKAKEQDDPATPSTCASLPEFGRDTKHHEIAPAERKPVKLPSTWKADMNQADLPASILLAAPSLGRPASSSYASEPTQANEARNSLARRRSLDAAVTPLKVPVPDRRRTSMPNPLRELMSVRSAGLQNATSLKLKEILPDQTPHSAA